MKETGSVEKVGLIAHQIFVYWVIIPAVQNYGQYFQSRHKVY